MKNKKTNAVLSLAASGLRQYNPTPPISMSAKIKYTPTDYNLISPSLRSTKIIYTLTDEAPLSACYSLLPIVKAFTNNNNAVREAFRANNKRIEVVDLSHADMKQLRNTEFLPGLSMAYLEKLAKNQDLLHLLDGKTFEILIAGLQHLQGFKVRLTKASHDGYIDIVAVKEVLGEKIEILTQCKVTQSPAKNTNINDVRAFFGVVCQTKANKGIFATLGKITRETRKFVASVSHKLQLFTKEDIVRTIKEAVAAFKMVVGSCYKVA